MRRCRRAVGRCAGCIVRQSEPANLEQFAAHRTREESLGGKCTLACIAGAAISGGLETGGNEGRQRVHDTVADGVGFASQVRHQQSHVRPHCARQPACHPPRGIRSLMLSPLNTCTMISLTSLSNFECSLNDYEMQYAAHSQPEPPPLRACCCCCRQCPGTLLYGHASQGFQPDDNVIVCPGACRKG